MVIGLFTLGLSAWNTWFVYFLQSVNKAFLYIGHAKDVDKRLREHNDRLNQSTKHYAPFVLVAYVAVRTEAKAVELEKYFKTGSGKAILKKRIISEAGSYVPATGRGKATG